MPNGSTLLSDGRYFRPDGRAFRPDGILLRPDGMPPPESMILFVVVSDDFKDGPLVLKAFALPFRWKKTKGSPDPENEDFARALKFKFHKYSDAP